MFDMLIERELVTPELDGSILPGVTRDSILSLTRSWGEFKVSERKFTMKDLVKADKEGRIIEMFGMLHYRVYLLFCFELFCAVHAEEITHFCHEYTSRENHRLRAVGLSTYFFGICRWHTWACACLLYFYHAHAHPRASFAVDGVIVDNDHGPWTNPPAIHI